MVPFFLLAAISLLNLLSALLFGFTFCASAIAHFLVFLFRIDDVRFPIPTLFFSATTAALRLPTPFHVTGVLLETFLLGLHFFTPLFFEDPHGFPFSSF
ncbi:MAG: hypothetical protein ACPGII_10790, partial [Opitutales bacterium]